MAVMWSIQVVCRTFQDATQLLGQVRSSLAWREDRRRYHNLFQEMQIQDLEASLQRGANIVRSQYERDYKRFGPAFARGDDIALTSLNRIVLRLQSQVIVNLGLTQQNHDIHFATLQDISDESQDRAILALMQLQQRCIVSSKNDALKPPPLFAVTDEETDSLRSLHQRTVLSPRSISQSSRRVDPGSQYHEPGIVTISDSAPVSRSSPLDYQGSVIPTYTSTAPTKVEKALLSRTTSTHSDPVLPLPASPDLPKNIANGKAHKKQELLLPGLALQGTGSTGPLQSGEALSSAKITRSICVRSPSSRCSAHGYKQNGSQPEKTFWGPPPIPTRQRPPIPIPEPTEHPVLQKDRVSKNPGSSHPSIASKDNSITHSRFSFSSTTSDSAYTEDKSLMRFRSWTTQNRTHNKNNGSPPQSDCAALTPTHRGALGGLRPSMAAGSISPRELLPSQANNFAGFCKGAWRLQIGDKKKAINERQRPGGMFNANRYWQCSKCKFEGRLVQVDKRRKEFDTRVLTTEGVQFRWEFLFKSHIEMKEVNSDFLAATFGCVFCTADGKGTPTFKGASSLMAHLQEHRDPLPQGEVNFRMNCLVGGKANLQDVFDLNIIGNSET